MTLTPAAINKYIKSILDNDKYLREFLITGEVSNVKYHSNGNIYFRIKDDEAQIDATMFAFNVKNNNFKLEEGQQIEALVSLSTIVKMGKYSLTVRNIKLSGQGKLFELYQKLYNKLQSEGLFENKFKKTLPLFPKRIGIVTSPTGAAIQDMITTLKRRHPIAQIVVIPCLVQGNNAANDIVQKLILAGTKKFDVIITGRGGGSIEDLWCFNEEQVVRTIFNLKTPVITSIGHESDTTLSDYVSDIRAATPTAAAELAACDLAQVEQLNLKNVNFIRQNLIQKLQIEANKLEYLSKSRALCEPLTSKQIVFDNLNWKLIRNVHKLHTKVNQEEATLRSLDFGGIIKQKIKASQTNLDLIHTEIDGLNPLAILSRGYSTIKHQDKYVKSVADVEINEEIKLQMHDGTITSVVTKKEQNER